MLLDAEKDVVVVAVAIGHVDWDAPDVAAKYAHRVFGERLALTPYRSKCSAIG
ncbi:MAG: hypothetical protein WB820_06905 [Rhodoplanes sp.]